MYLRRGNGCQFLDDCDSSLNDDDDKGNLVTSKLQLVQMMDDDVDVISIDDVKTEM